MEETEYFFVIEHQIREDGIVNTTETTRSSFKSASSYYHERFSKMIMNEEFPEVALMLTNKRLEVIERTSIQTQYKPKPKPEPEPENTSDSEENTENEGM